MITVGEMYSGFISGLQVDYEPGEAEQIAVLAFEHVLNFRRIDISLNKSRELTAEETISLEQILNQLKTGKPIQYVLGNAWFYGMKLKVSPAVLIPRRETEELVQWVIKDITEGLIIPENILDVGTGSGCIALALKKEFPSSTVTAIDFSPEALKIARMNAENEKLKIKFIQMDALNMQLNLCPDIVVSNPPYVTESERDQMHRRVTEFEPTEAIFVKSADPLIFYRSLASWAIKQLPKRGKIYFEINERMDEAIAQLLSQIGFTRIDFKKDFQGKIRMFRAIK